MASSEEGEIDNKCMRYVVVCARRGLVIVMLTIVICSYYLYVVVFCMLTVSSLAKKVFCLLFFHLILILLLWTYYQAVFTHIATTPEEFYLPTDVLRRFQRAKTSDEKDAILLEFAQNLPVQCATKTGGVRFCEICRAIKPDRAHHCSICRRCVLRMDHHCPWTNNCVCYSNYKFFHLLLFYSACYSLFVTFSTMSEFNTVWSTYSIQRSNLQSFEIVFMFYGAVSFATSFLPFWLFHLVLCMLNLTTLDLYRHAIFANGAKGNQFNIGVLNNLRSVFGHKYHLWFIPVYSSPGDGVTFRLRHEEDAEAQRLLQEEQTAEEKKEAEEEAPAVATETKPDN